MGSLMSDTCLSFVLIFVAVFSRSILSRCFCRLWRCRWSSFYARQIHSSSKTEWMNQSLFYHPFMALVPAFWIVWMLKNVTIEQSNCWVLLEHETHFATIKISCIISRSISLVMPITTVAVIKMTLMWKSPICRWSLGFRFIPVAD